ncbi:MAG: hypothetical protein CMH64_00770 [Nanoarchaeota archaeon]|nr:hypothetical protein [Nanoarchaeota archaeon]|tara:strand:- start:464 stop:727 length:264 start_codon:yes stop_codon:yes gene_type:complete
MSKEFEEYGKCYVLSMGREEAKTVIRQEGRFLLEENFVYGFGICERDSSEEWERVGAVIEATPLRERVVLLAKADSELEKVADKLSK